MQEEHAKGYLEGIPEKLELQPHERDEVEALFNHPGLRHLLGVLAAERAAFLHQLINKPVADLDQARQLGVTQGTIVGIDRIRHILLECVTVPTETRGSNG